MVEERQRFPCWFIWLMNQRRNNLHIFRFVLSYLWFDFLICFLFFSKTNSILKLNVKNPTRKNCKPFDLKIVLDFDELLMFKKVRGCVYVFDSCMMLRTWTMNILVNAFLSFLHSYVHIWFIENYKYSIWIVFYA